MSPPAKPASTRGPTALLVALALVAVSGGILLFLTRQGSGGGSNEPERISVASPPVAPEPSGLSPRTLDVARPSEPAPDTPANVDELDIPPPVPGEEPDPRPERTPMTQEDYVRRREHGLEVLDGTIQRVQRELEEAEHARNTEVAHRARMRLQRLTDVRAQRVIELEQARRGELRPDEPAGRRPSGAEEELQP